MKLSLSLSKKRNNSSHFFLITCLHLFSMCNKFSRTVCHVYFSKNSFSLPFLHKLIKSVKCFTKLLIQKKKIYINTILNSNRSRRLNYCRRHEKGTNSLLGFGGYCKRIAYLGTHGSLTTAVLNSAPATDLAKSWEFPVSQYFLNSVLQQLDCCWHCSYIGFGWFAAATAEQPFLGFPWNPQLLSPTPKKTK